MRNELHRSAELREDFQEWLDSFEPNDVPIRLPEGHGFEELAECGDILPADYCVQLDIPRGSTYAKAIEEIDPKASWLAKTAPRPRDWMVRVEVDVPVEDLCADYIAEDAAKEMIGDVLEGCDIVAATAISAEDANYEKRSLAICPQLKTVSRRELIRLGKMLKEPDEL